MPQPLSMIVAAIKSHCFLMLMPVFRCVASGVEGKFVSVKY